MAGTIPLSGLRRALAAQKPRLITPYSPEDLGNAIDAFNDHVLAHGHSSAVDSKILSNSNSFVPDAVWGSIANSISDCFGVAPNDCILVGSGKLGFSLAKKDGSLLKSFNEESDLDVAVVNSNLFDDMWRGCYLESVKIENWHKKEDFEKYIYRGWIRPDLLPLSFDGRDKWVDAFLNISRTVLMDQHQVKAGLYKSIDFLKGYQLLSIRKSQAMQGVI